MPLIAWIITFATLGAILWLAGRGASALLPPLCHPILLRESLDDRERAIFVAADDLQPSQASAVRQALLVAAALRAAPSSDHHATARGDLLDRCDTVLYRPDLDREAAQRAAVDDLRQVSRQLWGTLAAEPTPSSLAHMGHTRRADHTDRTDRTDLT